MSETEQAQFRRGRYPADSGPVALFPINQRAYEQLQRLADNDPVFVTIRRPRNIRQHRLMWSLYDKLADNMDFECTARDVHEYIKRKIGHVKEIGGEVIGLPTDFGAMPQDEFQAYFERVRAYILREVWPHLTAKELQNEIDEMIR